VQALLLIKQNNSKSSVRISKGSGSSSRQQRQQQQCSSLKQKNAACSLAGMMELQQQCLTACTELAGYCQALLTAHALV